GRCLASVLETVAGRPAEVVLVDSASTDGTVTVARRHPVRLVRLEPWARRSPAVARRLGAAVTAGALLPFVDGDSVLDPAWLGPALGALEGDPLLAGVAGACEGLLAGPHGLERRDQYPDAVYDDAPHLSGCALYRRAALEHVGGFNAALYGGEE